MSLEAQQQLERFARLFSTAVYSEVGLQNKRVKQSAQGIKAPTLTERKALVMARYGVTARQANALLSEADAKISAQEELDKGLVSALETQIRKKKRQLQVVSEKLAKSPTRELTKKGRAKFKSRRFQLQTAIARLTAKLLKVRARQKAGTSCITFGSKKLLRQRPGPKASRAEVQAWRKEWRASRYNQFLLVGSKDETAGCQSCVATANEDGTFNLRLRLPDSLHAENKFLVIEGVRFNYGAEHLHAALAGQGARSAHKKELLAKADSAQGSQEPKAWMSQRDIKGGAAVTWRFIRVAPGEWRVTFTTSVGGAKIRTSVQLGAVGVDFNQGFLSLMSVDRFGNFTHSRNISSPTRGFTANQREALMGEAVKEVIAQCVRESKPLMLEKLDFAKRKTADLPHLKQNRVVASLAYSRFKSLCEARAHDAGVQVVYVDPAYTSTQGWVRYARHSGRSTHLAAAGVIARRGLGFRERAPVCGTLRVLLAETAVEWVIPADMARSDVSRRWPRIHQGLRGAIASHFRKMRLAAERREQADTAVLGQSDVRGEVPRPKRAVRPPA